jgi:hypothetical protein
MGTIILIESTDLQINEQTYWKEDLHATDKIGSDAHGEIRTVAIRDINNLFVLNEKY